MSTQVNNHPPGRWFRYSAWGTNKCSPDRTRGRGGREERDLMGPRSQCERRWVFYLRKSRHCPKFGCVFFPQPLSARASTSLETSFSTFPEKKTLLPLLVRKPGWRGALYVRVCTTPSPSHTRKPLITPRFPPSLLYPSSRVPRNPRQGPRPGPRAAGPSVGHWGLAKSLKKQQQPDPTSTAGRAISVVDQNDPIMLSGPNAVTISSMPHVSQVGTSTFN